MNGWLYQGIWFIFEHLQFNQSATQRWGNINVLYTVVTVKDAQSNSASRQRQNWNRDR